MKIGDKIRITKTGREGVILGETATGWKIDFVDGDKPEFVSKNTLMEIVNESSNPNPKPNPRPKKRKPWGLYAILLLFAGAVVTLFLLFGR